MQQVRPFKRGGIGELEEASSHLYSRIRETHAMAGEMDGKLIHETAASMAESLVRLLSACLRPNEQVEALREFYQLCRASLENFAERLPRRGPDLGIPWALHERKICPGEAREDSPFPW